MLTTVPAAHTSHIIPGAPMPHNVPSAPMQPLVPRHAPIRHEPGTSVYVRGLADGVCCCYLRQEFESYGRVLLATVIIKTY